MSQVIRLVPESELRSILMESFINNSNGLVTKVADQSVLSGIIKSAARGQKKAMKDIALSSSHLFPDTASGQILDNIAQNYGIAPRLASSQSSTYLRVVGSPGTVYTSGVNTVTGSQGITFDLSSSVTLGASGYAYVPIRSQQTGAITNASPYTLTTISPIPSGHTGCINEYSATGGRDTEQDDVFRQRIQEGPDLLAKGTLSALTQVMITINSNVLNVDFAGINYNGKCVLNILTQNGINLTSTELATLTTGIAPYLNLVDLNQIGTQATGIVLQNVTYYPIDISFRASLLPNYDLTTVVQSLQIKYSKYVDFRFWDPNINFVDWTQLLSMARAITGFQYIPDYYFSPAANIYVPVGQYPRFRGFIVYGLNGSLLLNQSGTLQNLYYPNAVDNNYVITVL